ncbi:GNAT family N-acetyltransferase [Rhodoferax sp.]|uniref:GNAT family N-acetyltransferase n=1 Tax=Rhodoferax sp. TaxID=50421 RepID=UPI0027626003|nr:GNAT family N-acetyltransferase [Rhodoferax sp.]
MISRDMPLCGAGCVSACTGGERMDTPWLSSLRLFDAGDVAAYRLTESDLPVLQDFFVTNPGYFLSVNGMPPRADEAKHEFEDRPPPEMTFDEVFVIGFVDSAGHLIAMASVISNLLGKSVWHIGLFIVASSLHGSGTAVSLYAGLEAWMQEKGARWVRLGAVVGNARAERFWERRGYVEVRRRAGTQLGKLIQTVRVFVKPLSASGIEEYLNLVARDRPESRAFHAETVE